MTTATDNQPKKYKPGSRIDLDSMIAWRWREAYREVYGLRPTQEIPVELFPANEKVELEIVEWGKSMTLFDATNSRKVAEVEQRTATCVSSLPVTDSISGSKEGSQTLFQYAYVIRLPIAFRPNGRTSRWQYKAVIEGWDTKKNKPSFKKVSEYIFSREFEAVEKLESKGFKAARTYSNRAAWYPMENRGKLLQRYPEKAKFTWFARSVNPETDFKVISFPQIQTLYLTFYLYDEQGMETRRNEIQLIDWTHAVAAIRTVARMLYNAEIYNQATWDFLIAWHTKLVTDPEKAKEFFRIPRFTPTGTRRARFVNDPLVQSERKEFPNGIAPRNPGRELGYTNSGAARKNANSFI